MLSLALKKCSYMSTTCPLGDLGCKSSARISAHSAKMVVIRFKHCLRNNGTIAPPPPPPPIQLYHTTKVVFVGLTHQRFLCTACVVFVVWFSCWEICYLCDGICLSNWFANNNPSPLQNLSILYHQLYSTIVVDWIANPNPDCLVRNNNVTVNNGCMVINYNKPI
jgi:hypothetical protein